MGKRVPVEVTCELVSLVLDCHLAQFTILPLWADMIKTTVFFLDPFFFDSRTLG
jgi:hypothetical protein